MNCEKCGKTGRVIKYDDREIVLCENCKEGLDRVIGIYLEVIRGKRLKENVK